MTDNGSIKDELTSQRSRAPLNTLMAMRADPVAQHTIGPAQSTAATQADIQTVDTTIFNVPHGQSLTFAAEIPPMEGLAEDDAYLFITEDEKKKYSAVVVPKKDPTKQYEVPLADAELDTTQHTFHAKLADLFNFDIGLKGGGLVSASLDGKPVRSIDTTSREAHRLVRERQWIAIPGDEREIFNKGTFEFTSSCGLLTEGDSWIIVQKDYSTGRILKFTQSGTSSVGRLEEIQGVAHDPNWLNEIDGPVISSKAGVHPPASMIDAAVLQERYNVMDNYSGLEHETLQSLSGLITGSGGDAVRSSGWIALIDGSRGDAVKSNGAQPRAAELNAKDKQDQTQKRTWPQP